VVDAQFLFAMNSGLFAMHIKTECTAIDWDALMFTRSIRVFPSELFFTAARKLKKYLCQLGRLLKKIQTLTHRVSFQAALNGRAYRFSELSTFSTT
jgi:hypothetical protein